MMYETKVAVFPESSTKHTVRYGHRVEFLNIKPGGRLSTNARLEKVKVVFCKRKKFRALDVKVISDSANTQTLCETRRGTWVWLIVLSISQYAL